MDLEALFKISHGVYITGARDVNNRLIGSCIDAVMVVEVDPAQILISLCKTSYTCENVLKSKSLTLSVLPDDVTNEVVATFGMQSSRNVNKWEGVNFHLENDLPVLDNAVSVMTLEVASVQETATHYVFLCNVKEIKSQNKKDSLTYAQYQKRKKQALETQPIKKWVCEICGYVYNGKIPFEELPESWVCPLCGASKSAFVEK